MIYVHMRLVLHLWLQYLVHKLKHLYSILQVLESAIKCPWSIASFWFKQISGEARRARADADRDFEFLIEYSGIGWLYEGYG
jgi:hypothetical protein